MSAISEILKTLGPPFLAAFLSGYLVSRWKSREDTIEKRLDELIALTDEIAEQASEYWLLPATDPKVKLAATKVLAGISRIDGLRSAVSPFLSSAATNEIVDEAAKFLRVTTGGEFGVHNRTTDIQRASEILLVAASYCIAIRSARMSDLNGWRRRS